MSEPECALCHQGKLAHGGALGPILGPIGSCYVHRLCALWSPEVSIRQRHAAFPSLMLQGLIALQICS